MILIDANVLLYAYFTTFPQHPSVAQWLDVQLNGNEPVGIPWESFNAFMRID